MTLVITEYLISFVLQQLKTKEKLSYSHLKNGNCALYYGLYKDCFSFLSDSDILV